MANAGRRQCLWAIVAHDPSRARRKAPRRPLLPTAAEGRERRGSAAFRARMDDPDGGEGDRGTNLVRSTSRRARLRCRRLLSIWMVGTVWVVVRPPLAVSLLGRSRRLSFWIRNALSRLLRSRASRARARRIHPRAGDAALTRRRDPVTRGRAIILRRRVRL